MDKMKIVRIFGGFGNQMFMYAFYLKLRESSDMHAAIHDAIKYDLTGSINDIFDLRWELADEKDIYRLGESSFSLFNRIRRKLLGYKKTYYIQDDTVDETHLFTDSVNECYVVGYWQSYNYFRGLDDVVKELYDFEKYLYRLCHSLEKKKVLVAEENWNIAREIEGCHSVAVHIRGGDYRDEELNKIYGNICTKQYYQSAIEEIKRQEKNIKCYVFTNDPEYAQEILLETGDEIFVVDVNKEIEYSILDIYLMSKCKYMVIANSSFSWWGAFLNDRKKKVICPGRWINTKDVWGIYMDEWIRIMPDGTLYGKEEA